VRKGWETPEEHVQTVVDIRNFLNEVRQDILKWEPPYVPSIFPLLCRSNGINCQELGPVTWQVSRKTWPATTKSSFVDVRRMAITISLQVGPTRPSSISDIPIAPNSTEPPFDRYDWIVHRLETGEEVRYIIDCYSALSLPDGSPVFSLDVWPAFGSIMGVRALFDGWKLTWSDAVTMENQA